MPVLRPLLAAAAVVAVLAGAGPSAADPPTSPDGIVIDHGAGPAVVEQAPPGMALPGVPEPPSGPFAAVSVEDLNPGDGFDPFDDFSYDYGAYRFQLVTPNIGSAANIELVRPALQAAAALLTQTTQVQFSVDAGTVNCNACQANEHWPTTQPQIVGGQLNGPHIGIIRIRVSTVSPCGPLASTGGGTVGCASPSTVVADNGIALNTRGSVWLAPTVVGGDLASSLDRVLLHEIGHAMGLDHFSPRWPIAGTSNLQLMYPSVHSEPSDIAPFSLNAYHAGDRNGIWWLHHPFGWFASAAYQDFLGRIPDNPSYRAWLLSDTDGPSFLNAVATSNEALGRVVDRLYLQYLGRMPDGPGRRGWIDAIRIHGMNIAVTYFASSTEYFNRTRTDVPGRIPGTNQGYIRALYRDILGRDAETAGLAGWEQVVLQRGRAAAAAELYQSLESRRKRVTQAYCRMLDRPADPAGREAYAAWVYTYGDVALSVALASGSEYFGRSDDMALRPVTGPSDLGGACTGF